MKKSQGACLAFMVACFFIGSAEGTPLSGPETSSSVTTTQAQLTILLDSFVKETAASSLTCSIQAPKLVVEDVPSYGRYDEETNTITSPAWEQLSPEQKALFYRAAGPNTKDEDARAEFETGVHHWVFVHELGHWWEACRGMTDRGDHYNFELKADKIDASYWNEHDPSINAHQQAVFETIVKRWPNPVPTGQKTNEYFNQNYESLGPTPAYIWFQAQMCLEAFAEKPIPAFPAALAQIAQN